jgi:hypothetical protein
MPYGIGELACPPDDRVLTHQLTILAVSGLVCLTEPIPPRKVTSLFTPSTCVLLASMFPLPNCQSQSISHISEEFLPQWPGRLDTLLTSIVARVMTEFIVPSCTARATS